MKTDPIRVILTEHDFRRLSSGQVLSIHGNDRPTVEVALADIGYRLMVDILLENIATQEVANERQTTEDLDSVTPDKVIGV